MTVQSSTKDDLFNLDLIHSYVDKELNPRFVERHWLKQQVENKLANLDCRFVLLTAEPGAGKSAFMAWLAHQHPDWCRYFIRRDQRTPLGDVGSYSFLLQVGFQLAATYPQSFNQEQIKIVVEQRIGTATNSEIVGAEIGKIFASPFYEKVIQIQQQVTQSKDTNITGVRIGEFYATERDLPIENLQFMALFDPAKAMLKQVEAKEHPQRQIVVLVDALDELRYQDSGLSLLKWLTNCPELPANLRFVLTCRPDDDLLRAFRGNQQSRIQEISIAEEDPDVEKDLTCYTRFLIETPEVNQALIEMHQGLDQFTHQAVKKANGNFGYLGAIGRAVDEAIRQGQQELLREILRLSELPDTLQDLYAFFLGKIKDAVAKEKVPVEDAEGEIGFVPVWYAVYKPILGILSVALEPLTPTQIHKLSLIQAEFDYVTGAIEKLQQFLDQLGNCYRLYHSTLPEFFTSPKTKERTDYSYCYVDAVKQNQRIVNYYQAGAKSWAEVHLKKIAEDDYGRRHLAQHLVKGDRVEELHTLLSLEQDGKNAWFKLKDDEGDMAGFLADVDLAWAKVEEEPERESGRTIALQFRYALMIASVNSLAKIIPIELLINLVKKGVWVPDKGLSYALQNPDLEQRVEALINLAAYLSPFLKEEALQKVLNIAQENPYWSDLNGILSNLLPHLSEHLLPKALNIARSIQNESSRASALIALVPHLPEILLEALQTARSVQHGAERVRFLISLLPHLPDILPTDLQAPTDRYAVPTSDLIALATHLPETLLTQALEASQAIQDVSDRAKFLTALIPKLPEALPEALQAAQAIQDDYSQFQALAALIFHMPQILSQALQVARSIQDPYSHTKALIALIPYRSETVSEAVESAQFIESKGYYVDALADLLLYQPEIAQEAFQVAQEIQDDISRSITLGLLIPDLPETFFLQAFKESLSRQDHSRKTILYGVVPRLPEAVLGEAFNAAQAIKEPSEREFVLSLLASRLPEAFQEAFMFLGKCESNLASDLRIDLLPEAIEKAQTIQSEFVRADFLEGLALRVSESTLPKFLEVAQTIQGETTRLQVLTALPSSLQGETVLLERLRLVQVIHDESEQAQVLLSLTPYASEILSEALLVVPLIQSEYFRNHALRTLARELPGFALPEAISATRTIQDETSRAIFLDALIPRLTEDLLFEAFEIAQTVQRSNYGARTLIALASMLPESLMPKALKSAQRIYDGLDRLEFLITLAPKLPESLMPESIEIVRDTQGRYHEAEYASKRAEFLVALAPRLKESSLPTFLQIVQSIQSYSSGAEALIALLPHIPQVFPKALSAIRSIQYGTNYSRAKCLIALIPFSQEVFPEALEAFRTIQRADQGVKSHLYILRDLAPYQPEILWQEALSICRKADFVFDKIELLKILIPCLPKKLQAEAFQIFQSVEDEEYWYAETLVVLAPYFLEEQLHEAFQTARAFQNKSDCAKALTVLIPYIPEALTDAIEASRTIHASGHYNSAPPEYYRAKALLALLCYKPEILPEILELTQEISDYYDSEHDAEALAEILLTIKPSEALQVIKTFQHESWCVIALNALSKNWPDQLLSEVLNIIQLIQNTSLRFEALAAFAHHFPKIAPAQIFSFWQDFTHQLSLNTRSELLNKTCPLVPMIPALGNKEAVEGVISAIEFVGKWWP